MRRGVTNNGTVGGGLQIGAFSATLSAAQQSVVRVRLTSNDATRVLLSPDAATSGTGVIEIDVPAGQTLLNFHVHGADWMPLSSTAGIVTITFWADGFTGAATSVNYAQPALELSLPTGTSSASPNTDFTVRVGIPAADNATLASPQPRRAGASPLTVTVRNSQAAVAEIDTNGGGNGAQEQTASIAAGQSSTPDNAVGGLEFDPKAGGTTIVTASIPGFGTTTAAAKTVTVAASPADSHSSARCRLSAAVCRPVRTSRRSHHSRRRTSSCIWCRAMRHSSCWPPTPRTLDWLRSTSPFPPGRPR